MRIFANRDEIRSANLALISGRQMHRINACIFLVAITQKQPYMQRAVLCLSHLPGRWLRLLNKMKYEKICGSLVLYIEGFHARIYGTFSKLLFNTQ